MDELSRFIRKSIAKNEEQARQMLAQAQQEKVQRLLSQSGLGKRFQERTFENFAIDSTNKEAHCAAITFINNFPKTKGLLLTGSVGVGKTHLAAAIANELISKLYVVMFGSSADIISRMKQTFHTDESELDIIDALANVDLLVLDDLGKEKASDYTSTIIYQLVNRLYEDEKPILVTTNFMSEPFIERMGEKGEAIVSRLAEMCTPVLMEGPDWRVEKGEKNGPNHV